MVMPKKLILPISAVVIIIALAVVAVLTLQRLDAIAASNLSVADQVAGAANQASSKQLQTYIESGSYQAVFLDTGQVYFGKLHELNTKYFSLTDVYYLQNNNPSTDGGQDISAADGVNLVKLGEELHGPKDNMFIEQSKVTFVENMKDSSQVAKAIKSYEAKH